MLIVASRYCRTQSRFEAAIQFVKEAIDLVLQDTDSIITNSMPKARTVVADSIEVALGVILYLDIDELSDNIRILTDLKLELSAIC